MQARTINSQPQKKNASTNQQKPKQKQTYQSGTIGGKTIGEFTKGQWRCEQCTFLNDNELQVCKTCQAPKGTGNKKPQNQQHQFVSKKYTQPNPPQQKSNTQITKQQAPVKPQTKLPTDLQGRDMYDSEEEQKIPVQQDVKQNVKPQQKSWASAQNNLKQSAERSNQVVTIQQLKKDYNNLEQQYPTSGNLVHDLQRATQNSSNVLPCMKKQTPQQRILQPTNKEVGGKKSNIAF